MCVYILARDNPLCTAACGLAKGVIQSSIIFVKQSAPNDLYTQQYDSLRACVVVVQLTYTVSGTRDDSHTTTYISRYCLAERRQDARPYYKLFIATAVSVTTIGHKVRIIIIIAPVCATVHASLDAEALLSQKINPRRPNAYVYTVPSTISMAIDTDRDDGDENSH